ncbi:MAG: pyruvate ferredoxin oxidoreductase [Gammaproteobacteria bacterium]|nr:pyruvate ferredoxin oxidoreductase [Gammaproteobacteria bacterium]
MPLALEGSQALARTVALCRPQVVAAYPITPQTHIVENISRLVADGTFDCEFVSVESEFSAASVVLGAAAAGSRAYTASASQGIMLMSEVLFNIAGLRVPMVMTCANRSVGGPLNIWNDQQDSMAVRDSGWIQLYCADNQEAIDTTIQAYRIAERTELPVMVCVDGFTLTHTLEPLELPSQDEVDAFLPPYTFSRSLDPAHPISIGTLVTPEHFSEVRHAHHTAMVRAIAEIEAADRDWQALSGRSGGALLESSGPADATVGVLTIGSIHGTLMEAMAEYPSAEPARLIKLRCFRPFPAAAIRAACAGLERLVVVERALSPGSGGIVGNEVRAALSTMDQPPRVENYAVGLGGRDVPLDLYPRLLEADGEVGGFSVFDVDVSRLAPEDQ